MVYTAVASVHLRDVKDWRVAGSFFCRFFLVLYISIMLSCNSYNYTIFEFSRWFSMHGFDMVSRGRRDARYIDAEIHEYVEETKSHGEGRLTF